MAGLEGVQHISDTQRAVADGGDPLMAQDLAQAPLSEWDNIIDSKGPPADLDEFERNLRNQLERPLAQMQNNGAFNVASQLNRFQHDRTPQDPSGNNAATSELYDRVMDMANPESENYNPDLGNAADLGDLRGRVVPQIKGIADGLAAEYDSKITDTMEEFRNPEPEAAPEVAPDGAPAVDQGETPPPPQNTGVSV